MNHATMPVRICLALWCLVLCASVANAEPLERALDLLDRAAQARLTDPATSRTLAADAAALLAASNTPNRHANPAFQRALGNAHLLSDDLGRATLAFRRAHAADPTDPAIAASLTHARALIEAAPAQTRTAAWRRIALAASDRIPRAPIFVAAVVFLFLGCLLLACRTLPSLRQRLGAWPMPTAVTLLTLSAASAAFLAADTLTTDHHAAIVITDAPARTGPDADIYPPAFAEPLPPGTEVTIAETRDRWARIQLASAAPDAQAWVPTTTLERVHPPATLANPAQHD